ncbi:MAG: iron transporter [Candidatus Binatia bacterium]
MARSLLHGLMGLVMVSSFCVTASAEEFPIGEPLEKHGMEIAAVYVEPAVSQDEYWGGVPREEGAVIHLEADIHATKDNKHGFGAGEWIPYLTVQYRLRHLKTGEEQRGLLWQMVAKDGPHYGRNIKLRPGKYKLVYTIENPSTGGLARHTDKETGVPEWWDAFSLGYTFEYQGPKK